MKRIYVYTFLILLLLSLISCADVTTAKGTVEYMVEHMKRGNLEEAAKVLDDPSFMEEAIRANMDPLEKVVTKKVFEKGHFTIGDELVEGDTVSVEVEAEILKGEAISLLRDSLKKVKEDLPSDLSEEQIQKELEKAVDDMEWKGLATTKEKIVYHLTQVGDRWKILTKEIQVLTPSE